MPGVHLRGLDQCLLPQERDPDACAEAAVSGIHVIVEFGDNGVVYPGHNIPGLDFDTWNPVECQDQCLGDQSCRAWTWVSCLTSYQLRSTRHVSRKAHGRLTARR